MSVRAGGLVRVEMGGDGEKELCSPHTLPDGNYACDVQFGSEEGPLRSVAVQPVRAAGWSESAGQFAAGSLLSPLLSTMGRHRFRHTPLMLFPPLADWRHHRCWKSGWTLPTTHCSLCCVSFFTLPTPHSPFTQ